MKRNILNSLFLAISIALLIHATIQTAHLYKISKERQLYSTDLAYLNNIRFGLLNIEEWKLPLTKIIEQKVDDLNFNNNIQTNLQKEIEKILYQLINQVNSLFSENSFISQIFKSVTADNNQFKQKVPQWAQDIAQSIAQESNQTEIKNILQSKLDEYIKQTTDPATAKIQTAISKKYNFENIKECKEWLNVQGKQHETTAWSLTWQIILQVTLILLINILGKKNKLHTAQYYVSLIGIVVLLLGGLLTPMLNIDARIAELDFLLFGENISFQNQVLFFQSKSIFDLIKLIITEGNIATATVGSLIFTFSVIFPLLKILATVIAYQIPKIAAKNNFIQFFALKSGKWSMADVMVVAIFMSYIGFQTILEAQANALAETHSFTILSTHKYSTLETGFFLFFAFCISSMLFSNATKKRIEEAR